MLPLSIRPAAADATDADATDADATAVTAAADATDAAAASTVGRGRGGGRDGGMDGWGRVYVAGGKNGQRLQTENESRSG